VLSPLYEELDKINEKIVIDLKKEFKILQKIAANKTH
jgi:hypothetical protein